MSTNILQVPDCDTCLHTPSTAVIYTFASINGLDDQFSKRALGGVGDKVSLPLAPLLAALGLADPMMSGRGTFPAASAAPIDPPGITGGGVLP